MNTNISKILKGVIALIAAIATYFFIKIIVTGDDAIVEGRGTLGIVGPFIFFAKWLLYTVAGTTVVFSIIGLLKKPEALKKTLLGVVVLGILLAMSYGVASDVAVTDVTGRVLEGGEEGSSSKWVSTGIWYTTFLGIGAIVTIVLGGIKALIK